MTSPNPTPEDAERAAYIEGLAQLALILKTHPEIPLPYEGHHGTIDWFLYDDREQLAAIARAFPCTWDKRTWGPEGQNFELRGRLAGGLIVALNANRDAVCTRRVVGTEEREVEEVVTPAVTRTVTKEIEVVEWDCGPILGAKSPASRASEPAPECSACGATTELAAVRDTGGDGSVLYYCGDLEGCQARRIARAGAR